MIVGELMYFIGEINSNDIEVVNTDEGYTIKGYTRSEVLELAKEQKIYGVKDDSISKFDLDKYIKSRMAMDRLHGMESKYSLGYYSRSSELNKYAYRIQLEKAVVGNRVDFPILDGTASININAFSSNKGIPFTVKLPKSISYLGAYAFHSSHVRRVELWSDTKINGKAFESATELEEVYEIDTGLKREFSID